MQEPLLNSNNNNIQDNDDDIEHKSYRNRMKSVGKLHITHINKNNIRLLSPHSSAPPSPLPMLEEDRGMFGNPRLRWTILYAFIIVAITLLPLYLPLLTSQSDYINIVLMLLIAFIWCTIAVCALRNLTKMNQSPLPSLDVLAIARTREFKHIVIVPCYLDPLDILFDCLSSLLLQKSPENLIVVCTFEKKTPMLRTKIKAVEDTFNNLFGELLIIVHTLRPDKEIPGGCSNKNFALRTAYEHIQEHHNNNHGIQYTCTTCDTDSKFYPQYFEVLEACYNKEWNVDTNRVNKVVWQPPTFYNWDLDSRPFFVRVTGIMRSMMMLGGLISFDLNPMSIFSYPLELGLTAGFINPRYSVDDIIAKVRWMVTNKSSIPVRLLPVPVISGPTVGNSWFEEFDEWARQNRRWIVGSSESWHYFLVHFKWKPFLGGIKWFVMFFCYYAVLLCCAAPFMILAPINYPWKSNTVDFEFLNVNWTISKVAYLCLLLQYLTFAVAFIIDAYATNILLKINEDISFFRNILHLLSAPFVLLVYGVITFFSIIKFAIVGKKMAGHDMANKLGMQANATNIEADAVVVDQESIANETIDNQLLKSARLPDSVSFGTYSGHFEQ